jgi:hypothetical protein
MTLRPLAARSRRSSPAVLDYEIAQEQAAALGRIGRALEVALAALARFDSARAERREEFTAHASSGAAARAKLVQDASDALWCFVVQCEGCGLRDERQVVRAYEVPGEVRNRMGAFGGGRACRSI